MQAAAILAAREDGRDNTATTWMLHQTTVRLDVFTEEALKHDAFLDEALAQAGGDD